MYGLTPCKITPCVITKLSSILQTPTALGTFHSRPQRTHASSGRAFNKLLEISQQVAHSFSKSCSKATPKKVKSCFK